MGNSPTRSISYKPRMSDEQAYEKLPLTLKRCLQEAIIAWSSYATLRHFEKHGLALTIDWIHRGDEAEMKKGWRTPFKKATPSSYVATKVKPLRIYGITRTTRMGGTT